MKKSKVSYWLGLIFTMSGCLNLELETFVGLDGSGSAIVHYWTNFEILYNDTSLSNNFSFQENIIRNNFSDDNIEIKTIRVWKKDDDTTYHAEIKLLFDDINKLSDCLFFKNHEIKFSDGAQGQKIFTQKIPATNINLTNENNYKFKFTYHFPGQIVTENATERRNNTVIWYFTLDQLKNDKTLTATIKIPENYNVGYIITVSIFILIVLWMVLIFRKRKKVEE